jgi:hypothetical protein
MYIRVLITINILLMAALSTPCYAAELHGPYAKVKNKTIQVSTSLSLDPERAEEVRKGVNKEIIFYVDLFRVWEKWPDEFILGKRIAQTLRCDPVKNENLATSTVGNKVYKKRFTSCDELMDWSLSLDNVELSDISELESAEYYIRVTVESRIRELPPFINLILFFIEETEFKLTEESPSFLLWRP